MGKNGKSMETLQHALDELLSQATTALAALRAISMTAPGVLRMESRNSGTVIFYISWFRGPYLEDLNFAEFRLDLDNNGHVRSFKFGPEITSPAGMLAARLRREREKVAAVANLPSLSQ